MSVVPIKTKFDTDHPMIQDILAFFKKWGGPQLEVFDSIHLLAGEPYCLVMELGHELNDQHKETVLNREGIGNSKFKEALGEAFDIAKRWGGFRDDADVYFTRMELRMIANEVPIFEVWTDTQLRAVEPPKPTTRHPMEW